MLSLQVYKLIHFLGIFLAFAGIGGVYLHVINGGTKETNSARKLAAISHGLGLFLLMLGGFGMLARRLDEGVYESHMPSFVIVKLVVWLLIGGLLAVPYRKPELARPLWFVLPALGLFAAWLGVTQGAYLPF